MSVTEVKLIKETGGVADGIWTGQRIYRVTTDSLTDDSDDALQATAIPDINDLWKTGSSRNCRSKSATQSDASQYIWDVTVGYSSNNDGSEIENPLNRPTVFNWGGSTYDEPFFKDKTPTTPLDVTNSAGEPFADLPVRQTHAGTITITRNEAAWSNLTAEGFRDKTNSDAVTIDGKSYAAGKLLMESITATKSTENGTTFYAVTYNIKTNPTSHNLVLEDRGLNEKDGANDLKPILDSTGQPVDFPWPLNGSGAAATAPDTAPSQLTFITYETTAWASLSFS